MTKDLKEVTSKAAEIVKALPEGLQAAAFAKVFDALLAGGRAGQALAARPQPSGQRRAGSASTTKNVPAAAETGEARVRRILENLGHHPEIHDAPGALEAALHVLKVAREDAGEEWLTPVEISQILGDKYRLKYSDAAIRIALGRAGALVDRRPAGGRSFEYRIMAHGEKHLASPKQSAAARPVGRKRTASKRTAGTRAESKASKRAAPAKQAKISKPRGAKRPGPMALIGELLGEGFFDKPKTIADIIEHAGAKRAQHYKMTDLSPTLIRALHSGRLSRDRNAQGQFEYTKRK